MILPGARLTVASPIPEVLQLPWELLHLSRQPGGSDEVQHHSPAKGSGRAYCLLDEAFAGAVARTFFGC